MPQIGTSSALTQRSWRAGVTHEAERQAMTMGFVSDDDDAAFYLYDDLTKDAGDQIRVKFSPTDDTEDGFGDSDTIEGNEEDLEVVEDSFKIDYLALAYKQRGAMSQQRTNVDLKKAAFVKLSVRWARRWEQSIFNHLCGYTPAMYLTDGASNGTGDNLKRCGHNTVVQYDSSHVYTHAGETVLQDQNLDTTDRMTLSVINEVLMNATSKRFITYPLTPCSDGYFHLFMSPRQWFRLRENTTAGQWADLTRALLEGGQKWSESGFARGHLGTYGQVKLHVTDYVTYGVSSADASVAVTGVDRAVLVGARALHIGFGQDYASEDHLDWVEQVRDYRKWGVVADSIFGCKRTTFALPNGGASQTYGSFLIPTYEAAS